MIVRLFMPKDDIRHLVQAQLAEAHPHLPYDEPTLIRTLVSVVENADPTLFIAEQHGIVVGYITGHIRSYAATTGIYAEHGTIFVQPEKRGSRAAVLLISAFKDWAVTIGAREAIMGVANGLSPERTARLFERFGFKRVGSCHRWVILP